MSTAIVCISEDRLSERVAVKLLLLSLAKHCPDLRIALTFPPADEDFKRWVTRFPQVDLRTQPIARAYSWNVKPHTVLPLLEAGEEEVWWLDSDVILTDDFRKNLVDVSHDTIVVCEEALYGAPRDGGTRALRWGLELGRILPGTVNTCVVRMTSAHVGLLERWQFLLESSDYAQAQARPWYDRPSHMLGDQDVLTALLSSTEFADIPLKWFQRGLDIIQYFGPAGYTPGERLSNLRHGLPPLVHEQGGGKPWGVRPTSGRFRVRAFIDGLYMELSPYRRSARSFRRDIEDELEEFNWLDRTSLPGRVFRILGLGSAPLTGLPLALAFRSWSGLKGTRDRLGRVLGRDRSE